MGCRRCGGDGPFRPQRHTCKPCEAEIQRARYAVNPEKYRAIQREVYHRGRQRDTERYRGYSQKNSQTYRERHRDRLAVERREREASPEHKARYYKAQLVRNRVRYHVRAGHIIKPDRCERCGSAGPIEGAHADYDKPLEVTWLCRPCHRRWDVQSPKTVKEMRD